MKIKAETKLMHEHYNRIKTIIQNPNNTTKDLKAIEEILENFEKINGVGNLSKKLRSYQSELNSMFADDNLF